MYRNNHIKKEKESNPWWKTTAEEMNQSTTLCVRMLRKEKTLNGHDLHFEVSNVEKPLNDAQ